MDSEDGEFFVKQLASFVRTHEKALANALQLRRQSNTPRHGSSQSISALPPTPRSPAPLPERPSTSASTSNGLAAALSLGSLNFASHNLKPAKLALTPHHLFYLLSRFEELGINVGPMKVRLENLHDTSTSANYVSFLSVDQRTHSRGSDVVSIRSVSSVRSVMSGMSALWSSFGIGASISAARNEKQKAAQAADLKYLYSAFTKIPCLRLAPDWRARLIRGYEEFPFDSAVPLYVFKNLQALEVSGIDFRQFFGWDRVAEQIRSLTLKRACIDDPADILIDIVLDDMDKRRRRSSKAQASPTHPHSSSPRRSPTIPHAEVYKSGSIPSSPDARSSLGDLPIGSLGTDVTSPQTSRRASVANIMTDELKSPTKSSGRPRSHSPHRPATSRHQSTANRGSHKVRRSGSGSSHSSLSDSWHNPRHSASNLLATGTLPATKWRFLKHLSLADNSLTTIPATSFAPLANTLNSLDLSSNLLPRANRLTSLAGIEKLYPLERLDLRDNRLTEPQELARLTGIPDIREIWVEGNPFTRTHKDYRITIFNLFRRTPGYTEDIVIDACGPSYSEKRYLVERVAIPQAVPVVKPPVSEVPAVDVSKPTIIYAAPKDHTIIRKERPTPKAVASEINTSSTRRRRTPKRRIVDLATNDVSISSLNAPIVQNIGADASTTAAASESNYRISHKPEVQRSHTMYAEPTPAVMGPTEVPRINTAIFSEQSTSLSSQESPASWRDVQDWNVSGEIYRQKIEALRDKVGNGYLSVLNEESWESTKPPTFVGNFSAAPAVRPGPNTPRTVSAQAIHSGRTLG
ncbi:leucine Rich Repeat domain-containing protein [Apiospora saccharicola]|uniref:Leucine Rich Repeat domain-containing protein n=1 Tax=Apiospora saccharicola TaxID=335842 RepID=A0ABR1WE74_9PEZI